ncbi:MAG: helix-turn-helix transcriptional regulator [Gordonibacter sp.]|uniref:helix-turn-helix transcriptional regulator n=1 Tax=Gordonibacter sp. TaxID=1968902 RepID=UPI002FCA5868
MSYKLMLKQIRQARGISQKEMAKKLNMSLSTYRSWEQGVSQINLKTAFDLSIILDCTPNDLCGWPQGKNEGSNFDDPFEQELIDSYRTSTTTRKTGILQVARDSAAMSKETAECVPSEPGKREAV